MNLTSLDSDIAHMQSIHSTLFTKRAALQSDIASHKSLLSPIRRLPNEPLSEIFLFRAGPCTTNNGGGRSGGGDNLSNIPFTNLHTDVLWTILQVSSLWRATAQATPRLWNCLLIDLTPLGLQYPPHSLIHMPYTLPTHSSPPQLRHHWYPFPGFFSPLITAMCDHADRWGNVYFCPYTTNILASWNLDANIRQLSSTPRLTALGLTSFNPVAGFIQTPTQFIDKPNFRNVALYEYHPFPVSLDGSTFVPSFCRQLTHLYLDSCPYSTFSDILPDLRALSSHISKFPTNSNNRLNFSTLDPLPSRASIYLHCEPSKRQGG